MIGAISRSFVKLKRKPAPIDEAKSMFQKNHYQKQVVTGEFKEIRGNYIYTSVGIFHIDHYRIVNELGA